MVLTGSADQKFAYEGRCERLLDQWETKCREVSPAELLITSPVERLLCELAMVYAVSRKLAS